jgi:hypothetical protein
LCPCRARKTCFSVLPCDTRPKLITALRMLENNRDTNPPKKTLEYHAVTTRLRERRAPPG